MEQRETFTFGAELGDHLRLEVRMDAQGRPHLTLFRGRAEVSLLKPTLALLRYMVERPKQKLLEGDILAALWPDETNPNIVEKHISFLRKRALNDHPGFIQTIPKVGYKWLTDVQREGDLGDLEAFPKWNRPRFYELLGKVERGTHKEEEDLRIVTTGFNSGVSELDLEGLLRRNVRVKIVMMNPQNDALIDARYSLRKDRPKERAVRELNEQITEIQKLASQFPPVESPEPKGTLELKISDTMPCGFVVHSKNWALLGVFLAHDSYVAGPMLQIRSDTELWKKLRLDWDARWATAKLSAPEKRRKH
jgi:hypothetical protein